MPKISAIDLKPRCKYLVAHFFKPRQYNTPPARTQPIFLFPTMVCNHIQYPDKGDGSRGLIYILPAKSSYSRPRLPIELNMNSNKTPKKAERCAYIKACYLAEELKCFGYKADCPLYQKSNGEYYNEERFNAAVDKLINKTKAKHANISQ